RSQLPWAAAFRRERRRPRYRPAHPALRFAAKRSLVVRAYGVRARLAIARTRNAVRPPRRSNDAGALPAQRKCSLRVTSRGRSAGRGGPHASFRLVSTRALDTLARNSGVWAA